MNNKHEWKKAEKAIYMPKRKPEKVVIPKFKFFTIEGEGNPNDEFFGEYIGVLYSLSYVVRMSHKKGMAPDGYYEYTVYPLEGVWDLKAAAKKGGGKKFSKDDLVFTLMMRQPDFVDAHFAAKIIEWTKENKPHELLDQVKFEELEEGPCVQMLHVGPYDDEPQSFQVMEAFAQEQNLKRKSKIHREIYLSDARRTAPEKLKTVLRFQVA